MASCCKKHMSVEQRTALLLELSKSCKPNGKPSRGAIATVSLSFGVHRATVWRLWNQMGRQLRSQNRVALIVKPRTGRPKIEIDLEKVENIELRKRTSIRRLAKELHMTKSSVGRRVREGVIRRHTNSLKPLLIEDNKLVRMKFCLSMIDNASNINNPMLVSMDDYIHVDEKWFYITQESQNYYLTPDEMDPDRTTKSKRFITKVMFLTAVARPRTNAVTGEVFDGKIGIWPFTFKAPAQRSSKNRVAGTLETKVIHSVTQEVYRRFLVEKLLPAIKDNWPDRTFSSRIFVQQDNAKPHIGANLQFEDAARRQGLNVKVVCQPPNSPDLNALDLGYFRSIQSLQQVEYMGNIDELINAVTKSFEELSSDCLNKIFVTLQLVMVEVLKAKGSNKYKIPHVNKDRLLAAGILPRQVSVNLEIIEAAIASVVEMVVGLEAENSA